MKTTITLSNPVTNMLTDLHDSTAGGANIATELFCYARRATLRELAGMFTREEIIAMADGYNGKSPTWQYLVSTDMLLAHVADSEKFEKACTRHKAEPKQLYEKIKKLTSMQAAILQIELWRFWNRKGTTGYGSPSRDLDKLVKFLS